VLHDINLRIGQGETHVLMGPNGSGKSTLLKAIMGFGGYKITAGSIVFKGKDITHLPIHERANLGIGMMFQHRACNIRAETRETARRHVPYE